MEKDKNLKEQSQVQNSKDFLEMEGEVLELMPATTFKVALEMVMKSWLICLVK